MSQENIYNLTLDQQVESAHHMLNDVQLQRAGAIALQSGRLEVTSDQYHIAHAQMASSYTDRLEPRIELQAGGINGSAEADAVVTEKLHGIVERSGIAVNTYMSDQVIPRAGFGWRTLYGKTVTLQESQRFAKSRTAPLPLAELNTQGVSEVVTFIPLADNSLLSKVPGYQSKGSVTVVTYESTDTASKSLMNLSYADRSKLSGKTKRYPTGFEKAAPGASFSYNLFMSEQDAATLRATITKQPDTLHQFNEVLMTQAFGANPDGFREKGPQYDAWREADNGQSKLAIRESFESPVVQSKILEY